MTDKQIMIDGVDVSRCGYFVKRRERFLGILQERCKCEIHYNEDCLCEIRTNCYYKQLKRKEQECERLTSTLTEIKEIARVGAFYWKHYKEESKSYNEILQKISECEVE